MEEEEILGLFRTMEKNCGGVNSSDDSRWLCKCIIPFEAVRLLGLRIAIRMGRSTREDREYNR